VRELRICARPGSWRGGHAEALAATWNAEDKDHARAAANVSAADYGTTWPLEEVGRTAAGTDPPGPPLAIRIRRRALRARPRGS
jgi:hypothetical protein